jgi:hypothetical protein
MGKTGCLLGDWTDELGKSVWIVDWVSTGPKSYCYKTNIGKVVCKIIVIYLTSSCVILAFFGMSGPV